MQDERKCKLSPSELTVIGLLFKGETLPAVARKLNLSINTIKAYVKSIHKKLHVHNRAQLVRALARMQDGNEPG